VSDITDPVLLARVQFAANMSFHILFPTITIALGWYLLFFKLRFRATKDAKWMTAYAFWVKVFALSFALGVVSGITMSFQFGTNWPGYMLKVGNIAGPLLAYEVLTAFFLEATFLGVMLFGRDRVGDGVHTLATFLVAAGTTLSAFWILALDSWMQTPAGFAMVGGVAHPASWLAVIFNPSFPYRLVHMLLASALTASFLIAGVSAYQWLRGDRVPAVRAALRCGVFVAALLVPVQVLVGDQHGLNTFEHQPAKIAAIEGVWETERGAPVLLFGWPNAKERRNDFAIGVPKVASLILTHDPEGEIRGLAEFPEHPPVFPVFWAFRVMVGVGLLMLAVSWLAAFQLRRGGEPGPRAAVLLVGMTFAGWIATLAGWWVTEIGRQPWLVTGLLLTRDAASAQPAPILGISLAMYLSIYAFLIVSYVGVVFHLARKRASVDAERDLGQELPA
jgi:cytochrome d ubiquinol oxidase subunit I